MILLVCYLFFLIRCDHGSSESLNDLIPELKKKKENKQETSNEILNALEEGIMVVENDEIVYKNEILASIFASLHKSKEDLDILDFNFCKIY